MSERCRKHALSYCDECHAPSADATAGEASPLTADENLRRAIAALTACQSSVTGATLASIYGVDVDALAQLTADAARWREIREHLISDQWCEDEDPSHACTTVAFKNEQIAWRGWFLTIEQVVDNLAAGRAASPGER